MTSLVERCDVSQLNKRGTPCPSARFVAMASPTPTADAYMELDLTGAGALLPLSPLYYEWKGAFHMAHYDCTFHQANDYSFTSVKVFTTTQTITAYRNGVLIWGTEP